MLQMSIWMMIRVRNIFLNGCKSKLFVRRAVSIVVVVVCFTTLVPQNLFQQTPHSVDADSEVEWPTKLYVETNRILWHRGMKGITSLTWVTAIDVARPGLTRMPWSSGNGIWFWGSITTTAPAVSPAAETYSLCWIFIVMIKPVKCVCTDKNIWFFYQFNSCHRLVTANENRQSLRTKAKRGACI